MINELIPGASGEWLKISDARGNQEVYAKLINDQEWNGSCAGSYTLCNTK